MKYLSYNVDEHKILRSFSPFIVVVEAISSFIFLLISISVFFVYVEGGDNGWNWYFSLYSYWAMTLVIIALSFAFVYALTRIFMYYRNMELISIYSNYLNFLNIFRDSILIVALLNSFISTTYYLGYIGFSASGGYATIISHGPHLLFLLFIFFISVVYFSLDVLAMSLIYCGVYYTFTIILFYKNNGWWVYDLQDPNYYDKWWSITVVVILAQIGFYFLLALLQFLKNKFICWIYKKYVHVTLVREVHEFSTKIEDHVKIKLLVVTTILILIDIYTSAYLIICFGYLIRTEFMVGLIGLIIASFIGVINVLLEIYFSISIFVGDYRDSVIIKYLNSFLIVFCILKFLLSIILFFIFAYEARCWIWWGLMLISLMEILLRITAEYWIFKWNEYLDTGYIIIKSLFFFEPHEKHFTVKKH